MKGLTVYERVAALVLVLLVGRLKPVELVNDVGRLSPAGLP